MYLQGGGGILLKAGDVFLLQPGLVHEGQSPPDALTTSFISAISVCFPLNVRQCPWRRRGLFRPMRRGEGQYDMEHCVLPKLLHIRSEKARGHRSPNALTRPSSGPAAARRTTGFWACKFLEILMAISQNSADAAFEAVNSELPARTMRRMEELTAYLNEQYMEKITGKQLEDMLGMNFDYLNSHFPQTDGKNHFPIPGQGKDQPGQGAVGDHRYETGRDRYGKPDFPTSSISAGSLKSIPAFPSALFQGQDEGRLRGREELTQALSLSIKNAYRTGCTPVSIRDPLFFFHRAICLAEHPGSSGFAPFAILRLRR